MANPMPTVSYGDRTYKLRSRKTVVPDFDSMERLAVLVWLVQHTTPRGYSRVTNTLAGYGGAIQVTS